MESRRVFAGQPSRRTGIAAATGGAPAVTLHTDLVAYWSLEEAAGAARADDTGRGNTLTDVATVGQGTGKIAFGAQFNAASSRYLKRASGADLQMGDVSFTISAWVKFDSIVLAQVVLSKDDNTAGNREYILYWNGSALQAIVFSATDVSITANGPSAAVGTWYHLLMSHDSLLNTLSLDVNLGGAYSVGTGAPLQAAGSAEFRIGGEAYPAFLQPFDGIIDEVGIWKRILTAAERTQLYNAGAGLAFASF